jgi:oxygen-independent coproporphyrinogen-3 oxidase
MERELARAEQVATEMGGVLEYDIDSIYLGGGTPSVLAPDQLATLFRSVRDNFNVLPGSEITVEVAPGTLSPEVLEVLVASGVNRVSLGMQSFINQETRSVGRLHTHDITLADIASLRSAGITEISLDLIAGLPHQTAESWDSSLSETIATGVPHVSVYMLEVDEDSRLGRELIAGGTRYHAHQVPDDDLVADFYLRACGTLNSAGLHQYEISNFACDNNTTCHPERSADGAESKERLFPSHASRHNLKYWLRQPYLGFGVDAHSMLCAHRPGQPHAAVRFATTDNLDALLSGAPLTRTDVEEKNALEEVFFLGLRLNRGVNLNSIETDFSPQGLNLYQKPIAELTANSLLSLEGDWLRLTDRGRLLSNDVFSRFLAD